MRRILACTIVLTLASCATQPAAVQDDAARHPLEHSMGPSDAFDVLSVRVGVEYVPTVDTIRIGESSLSRPTLLAHDPDRRAPDKVTVVAMRTSEPAVHEPAVRGSVGEAWTLGTDAIEEVEDPYAQVVLEFVDDVIGEDRRRLQQEFGAPVLLTRVPRTSPTSLRNAYDERLDEEQASFNHGVINRLVRKPFRRLLRNLPLVSGIEAEFDDFKGDHLPVTQEYQEQHGDVSWGRISGRVRIHDGNDPVELSYVNFGCRVGSSQKYMRLGYDVMLWEGMFCGIGYKRGYDDETPSNFHARLHWRIDPDNQVHVVAGDNLHFLDGPTAYSNNDSRMDGERGVLFYVEHLF